MPGIRCWLIAVTVPITVTLALVTPASAQYNARYAPAPLPPLTVNQTTTVQVKVTNTGSVTWENTGRCPVVLGYRWYYTQTKVFEDTQGTPLPTAVAPGQTVELAATIEAPSVQGSYTLAWDLRAKCEWFTSLGVAPGLQPNVEVRAKR